MSLKKYLLAFVAASVLLTGTAIATGDDAAPVVTERPGGILERDFTLRLAEFAFDPLEREPSLPEGWDRSAATRSDLHLIQFDGPIPADALAKLRDGGLKPVQYVHPHAYIVWGPRDKLAGLNLDESSVRWSGDFAPAYRVQPQWRDLPSDEIDVKVLLVRSADPDAAVAGIVTLGGGLTLRKTVSEKLEVAGFRLPGDRIQAAATIPGVYTLQVQTDDAGSRGEVANQISAGNIDGTNLAFPGYGAWLATLGLDGSGVTVAVVDEGIDQAHPDLVGRMLSCGGASCEDRKAWHGTHTAGLIAADATTGELDAHGFERGLGVAPGANLLEQVWFPIYREAGGMLQLMTDSSVGGAVISNNSWGSALATQGYDIDTLLVDAGVRDSDPGTPGNQPLIHVQAISNGDGGVSSQGTPDDGKNIFSIGSTPVLVPPDGEQDLGINDLAFNTGHGPALDGRTLPHMVAPGCYADSTYWETPQDGFGYRAICGTSMAAAHVSGAVALFVERYRGLPGLTGDPSPALVKAAFLPVAHDLDGGLDADDVAMGHRPDNMQGWGRLDLAAVLDPPDPVLYFDESHVFEFTGQEWMRVVTAANPAEPMRIMLVWTDAPGHGLGGATPAWNNDIDLIVESGGQTYLGNDLGVDGYSTTGGTSDTMNNAEGVFLQSVAGDVTIRVAATDINSNGVPNHGDETDQDFALACYNCALVPDFALWSSSDKLSLCAPETRDMTVSVEALASFGDPVSLSTSGVPAGAIASFSDSPVTPSGVSVLTFDPGTAVDGDHVLQILGDSATLNRSISLELGIRAAPPTVAVLGAPADTAIDVDPRPDLSWNPVPWTDRYLVEVSTDPTFEQIFYSAMERTTAHTPQHVLEQDVVYYWRVRATNACGYGGFSPVSSFTTAQLVNLLLVDDDYDLPDYQATYTNTLDSLGVTYDVYDVWNFTLFDEPDARTLEQYDRVIWYSAEEEIYAGPNSDSELALPDWLDRGTCLLVTSADYINAQGGVVTTFMQDRLGVGAAVGDTGMTQVTGAGTPFDVLGTFALDDLNPDDWRDSISPDGTAELAFSGDLGDAGITKDGGWYRTSFLGFGLEHAGVGERAALLFAFFAWCDGLAGVDGDGDGTNNENDCLPGDDEAWTAPSPVTDLVLGKGAVGFSWSQPVSGSGSVYDVLRSGDPTEWYDATCVAAGYGRTPR